MLNTITFWKDQLHLSRVLTIINIYYFLIGISEVWLKRVKNEPLMIHSLIDWWYTLIWKVNIFRVCVRVSVIVAVQLIKTAQRSKTKLKYDLDWHSGILPVKYIYIYIRAVLLSKSVDIIVIVCGDSGHCYYNYYNACAFGLACYQRIDFAIKEQKMNGVNKYTADCMYAITI